MSDQPDRIHLGYLDGLRGWAACFVVLHHIWQFAVSVNSGSRPPRWFSVTSVLQFGEQAVTVFIVLSGYVLMLPVVRRADERLPGGILGFFRRRSRRILPPYYATLALGVALLLFVPRLVNATRTHWDIALPALTTENLTLHVFLLHNLSPYFEWKLNPPLWSVALEWQIYMAFALVLLPVWRRLGPVWMFISAVVLGLSPIAVGGAFAKPWFTISFALGMSAAALNFSPRLRHLNLSVVPWRIVISVFAAVAAALLLLKSKAYPVVATADLCVSIAAASFLVRTTNELKFRRRSLLVHGLSRPLSLWLGAFSYSLYLLHFPFVAAFYVWVGAVDLSAVQCFLLLTFVAMPLIMILSYGFYRAFEQPFTLKPPPPPPRVEHNSLMPR